MNEMQFAELFTDSVDVIFAFHGFPGAISSGRAGSSDADHLHVRGFIEQGTTTTSFDMTALNRVTRYHLVMDAINNARRTLAGSSELPSTHLGNSKAAISQVNPDDLPVRPQ